MKAIIARLKEGDIQATRDEILRFGVDIRQFYYETYLQTPIFFCTHIMDDDRSIGMMKMLIELGCDPTYKDRLR